MLSTLTKIPLLCVLAALSISTFATPPYGDSNQPYDRLPGTLETYHVKWAKPRTGGPLNVLFIIPYYNSREVVEAAQRLDLTYTVIMNAGYSTWAHGSYQDATATPLKETEAETVLEKITRSRLSVGHHYDAIVIAKVSWPVIPDYARELILQHVDRGTGLVYVTPNRLLAGLDTRTEYTEPDPQFQKLFETNTTPATAAVITRGLPLDVMPIHPFSAHSEYRDIPGVGRSDWVQSGLCITATKYGKGRIVGLDYFDEMIAYRNFNSLSPFVAHPQSVDGLGESFPAMYDYAFALLARAVLWSAQAPEPAKVSISFDAPATDLKAPVDENRNRCSWVNKTPQLVIARNDLAKTKAVLSIQGAAATTACSIRDITGMIVMAERTVTNTMQLPLLPRGTYLLDARLLDTAGQVLDFASTAFRVESKLYIKEVKTAKDAYAPGEKITGTVNFSVPVPLRGHQIKVRAVDTWGRTAAKATVQHIVGVDGLIRGIDGALFELPVNQPLSRLWDIEAVIEDENGVVDKKRTWVGLPDWTFDDYMFMLIFAPSPQPNDWKGQLWGKVMREYGINSTFTFLIYNRLKQYEINERSHLMSVSYAEHMGEHWTPADAKRDKRQKQPDLDLAALSIMCRQIADTGEPLDPEQFPQKQGHIDANWLNTRLASYHESARFGSPLYVLTGENYLLGDFDGLECSGFGPVTTALFKDWCREQYDNDLAMLNAEWNTSLESWDDVRGIMLQAAVEQDQMPRWVDFRYFMRSKVWTQFFIDYTDMIRTVAPQIKTGRVGHDHFDFSEMREHMTSSKVYVGQEANSEWRHAMATELLQSFSGDKSFLLAAQAMMRWHFDFATEVNRERWPWICLFMGLNGFDWERGLLAETLGGESCMTPCMSEPLPYFLDIADQVKFLQRGIGKLTITAKPYRSNVAILWSPQNHYVSRLHPFQKNAFSGTWLYNISVVGGAPADALALMNSLRVRPTMIGPQDVVAGELEKRGFKALLLPYSKGMSKAEADAVRAFVAAGGLVIADNQPGIASEHGRTLEAPRLGDLFPVTDKVNVVHHGQGHAAYLPNVINGYLGRHEKGDFTGSDAVEQLLREYSGTTPPIELLDEHGMARRDTLMPVFTNGATTLVGLLRCGDGHDAKRQATTIVLPAKAHVWDVRTHAYRGYTDRVDTRLDLRPQYFAILPARSGIMLIAAERGSAPGGEVRVNGTIEFEGTPDNIVQTLHVQVYGPTGEELEWFRQNHRAVGSTFGMTLPIAYSAIPGRYRVTAKNAITGITAECSFDVK
jgi:hypothetical protein